MGGSEDADPLAEEANDFFSTLKVCDLFGFRKAHSSGPAGLEDPALRQQLEKPEGVHNSS